MKTGKSSFIGPGNIHARRAVLCARIEGAADVVVSARAISRLNNALGTLRNRILDLPAWRRMMRHNEPLPAAAVVEVLAVIAQRYAYWPVRFCHYRAPAPDAEVQAPQRNGTAIFEAIDEQIGRAAVAMGVAMVESLVDGAGRSRLERDFLAAMQVFLDATLSRTPSADALHMAQLATARDIPWHVLGASSYVRIGLGRHAEIIKGTESTRTSSIGKALSRDKSMTQLLLSEAGLPVAAQRTARTERAAMSAANELGYPLVVKPIDGNMGRDVSIGVADAAQMRKAFARAVSSAERAVIEQLIPGAETRLLVVNGRLQSAVRREPAQVIGDGKHSIAELVEIENRNPEREALLTGALAVMKPIQLDDDAVLLLDQQGLTSASVPPAGERVLLRRESNISRGGSVVDITDQVHPSIRRAAEQAARILRLDICGVDFITPDLSRHWRETGGAICEVNSRPGINMQLHFMPDNRRRKILAEIFSGLMGEDYTGRIPVVALVGTPAVTASLCAAVERQAQREGRVLGIVGGSAPPGPTSRPMASARELFAARDIDAALLICEPGALLENGLGLSRIDAALFDAGDTQADKVSGLLQRIAPGAILPIAAPAALHHALTGLKLLPEDGNGTPALPQETDATGAQVKGSDHSVLFVGDIGFGESYLHHPRMADLRQILATEGHEYSLRALLPLLQSADCVIGNLEVPLAAQPSRSLQGRKNYLGWCDPMRTVQALQAAGITAVSLANNHALDCGLAGMDDTFRLLDAAGIRHFGAGGNSDEALRPHIHQFTVGQTRRTLVVFAGFEHRHRYATDYDWYASRSAGGVGVLSPRKIEEWILHVGQALQNPIFVAYPHWGTDYKDITASQRHSARLLIEAGIDIVIGHGAHITQAVEIVDGKTVVYNIGNFVWNTPGRFNRRAVAPFGMAAVLRFGSGLDARMALDLYPLIINNDVTRFQNRPVTAEEFTEACNSMAQNLPYAGQISCDEIGNHFRLLV